MIWAYLDLLNFEHPGSQDATFRLDNKYQNESPALEAPHYRMTNRKNNIKNTLNLLKDKHIKHKLC